MSGYTKTGKFLDADQVTEAKEAYHEASNTPMIALSSAPGLSGNDMASRAWMRFHRLLYDLALATGLPEIEGWYGLDTTSGEILGPEVG